MPGFLYILRNYHVLSSPRLIFCMELESKRLKKSWNSLCFSAWFLEHCGLISMNSRCYLVRTKRRQNCAQHLEFPHGPQNLCKRNLWLFWKASKSQERFHTLTQLQDSASFLCNAWKVRFAYIERHTLKAFKMFAGERMCLNSKTLSSKPSNHLLAGLINLSLSRFRRGGFQLTWKRFHVDRVQAHRSGKNATHLKPS